IDFFLLLVTQTELAVVLRQLFVLCLLVLAGNGRDGQQDDGGDYAAPNRESSHCGGLHRCEIRIRWVGIQSESPPLLPRPELDVKEKKAAPNTMTRVGSCGARRGRDQWRGCGRYTFRRGFCGGRGLLRASRRPRR